MKPTTRVVDYAVLIQDGVLTVEDVPQDVKSEVTKWVRYFQGIKNNGAVKETSAEPETDTYKKSEVGSLVVKDDKSDN